MRRLIAGLVLALSAGVLHAQTQLWSGLLNGSQAINWSNSGVGGIPARTTNCASLTPSASLSQINSALASCPSGQTVYLAAGTYSIPGTINIPSNVTLRGAGANQTILNATGSGGNVVSLGTGSPSYQPISISSGATAGSTSIGLSSASGIQSGMYLVISETNNSSFVTSNGSEGLCSWCDGWTSDGSLARGQVVAVTGVSGNSVTISPGLYGAYTNNPIAVPFKMSASYAGVENLQVYANNSGYASSFGMSACAYCWIKGVETNYTDGDHVEDYWGYRDEIRDSYFSNAYLHQPGTHDSDVVLGLKTSATLVENNIVERTHESIMLEWGAAGNVIGYNYTTGSFDSNAPNFLMGGISFHGAHPQYNLVEGNVTAMFNPDSVWGSSSQATLFRNWVFGTSMVCTPYTGRGTVNCSSSAGGHHAYQAARAIDISYLSTRNNFLGNVVGSAAAQGLPLTQTAKVEYPATRSYDSVVYDWSFGYGEANDDGSGTGCDGPSGPCHLAGTSASDLLHGNFDNISTAVSWASGLIQTLPSSFYLTARPAWWTSSMPFPSTGPDVTGGTGPGGHTYGNPAQSCYLNLMHGTDGGSGSPLSFNANTCYGTAILPPPPPNLTGSVVAK